MNAFALALAYLRARALNTALNVLLLSLGIATISVLLLVSHQLGDRMLRDGRGIDLVLGAKGSPVQLILSAVYQVDFPTGNIPLAEAERLHAHPMVRETIPLALGDSFQGQRIVGTEHAYAAHYGASLAEGRLWQAPFEATLGARAAAATGLRVGDRFFGAHGLAGGDHLHVHEEHPYEVVGVLAPTGTVIDRLILTPVETVWAVHEHGDDGHVAADHAPDDVHADEHDDHEHGHDHEHDGAHAADGRQITALLIKYATPLAAVSLPREINDDTTMQAASPAMETARLLSLVGVGLDTLRAFGWLLVASAALSIFIALYNAMRERRHDLAIMRSLGARPAMLFGEVMLEGLLMVAAGVTLGLLLGHGTTALIGAWLPEAREIGLGGGLWLAQENGLIAGALLFGALASLLPALLAYRTDIATTLARR